MNEVTAGASAEVEGKSKDHRSVSSVCDFKRCPRRYYWGHQLRLQRPSPERDLAMRYGSAIHAAMPFSYVKDMTGAMARFRDVWGDGDSFGDKKRNSLRATDVMADLCALHGAAGYRFEPLKPPQEAPVGEFTSENEWHFEVDIGLPSGKTLMGVIDAVLREKESGGKYVVEYKTASQIWKTFGEIFVISPQMQTYVMAMRVSGVDVVGAMVEGVLVAAGKTEVVVVPENYEDEDIEDIIAWWKEADRDLARYETTAKGPMEWRAELSACVPYPQYGLQGWACEFQPLCKARERWEELRGMYEVKPQRGEEKGDGE